MASKGQASDLNQSSSQALLALLKSISPDAVPKDGKKLSEEDVRRLSDKLTQLMGKDAVEQYEQPRNARGELVNEEGLPIVDVTEPFDAAEARKTVPALVADEEKLIPLSSLSQAQQGHLRRQRDRLLDKLEEEERLEQLRERERVVEGRKDLARKKREEAAKEKDGTKTAKEMQKKMGKALLHSRAVDEVGKDEKPDLQTENSVQTPEPSKAKKTVSFATQHAESLIKPRNYGYGKSQQVSLGKLRPMTRPTLLSEVQDTKRPMKTLVIERKPVGQGPVQTEQQRIVDSDDESNPEAEDHETPGLGDENTLHANESIEESDSGLDAAQSEILEEDTFDLDYAQHQREIAFEYYAKRGTVGQAAAQAMMSHADEKHEGEKVIPPDVGVVEPHSKPPISHFKASKFASSYNASVPAQSTSLDGSVLPASSAKTLQHAIRMGKLDPQDRLIGDDDDSGSDLENEAMQEIIDLLKKGEVYNVGPEGNQTVHAIPKPENEQTSTVAAVNPAVLPPLSRPGASKFKLDRSQAGPSSSRASRDQPNDTSPGTKTSNAQTAVGSVTERQPRGNASTPLSAGFPGTALGTGQPSSAAARQSSQRQPIRPASQSTITESPLRPSGHIGKDSLTPSSMIVESPSFPRPAGESLVSSTRAVTESSSLTEFRSLPNQDTSSRRPTRPPTVMSSVVREKPIQPTNKVGQAKETQPPNPKKVSRFRAERT
ncbi:hypothetical protein AX17_002907 [Amanita inopinata Kibby_2008]|nr:hypothetical protein AX17_002907 [Amanita inopinata Kibby_2008]